MSSAPSPSEDQLNAAQTLFGDRLPMAQRYVEHLCTTGIDHGLLGPREVERIWPRHVLNCAVLGPEVPDGAEVADVGSGAGLPGLAMALAQPEASFSLIEPMERRVDWLAEVVADLKLDNVAVIRARAEELTDEIMADVVTARAVSGLKRLLPLTVPLMADDGELLLMKGRSAADEIASASSTISKYKLQQPQVQLLGEDVLEEPTTVVRIRRR